VKLVFVDTETTGLDRQADEIIELAALRVDWPSWTTEAVFYQRFRPEREVSPEAAAANGYTEEAWRGSPDVDSPNAYAKIAAFVEFTDGARWVGSMPQFDYDFLERARARGLVRPWALASRRLIDVGSLGTPLLFAGYGEKGGLDELCTVLDVSLDVPPSSLVSLAAKGRVGAHTAMGDALRTRDVFRKLMSAFTASPALAPLFPLFAKGTAREPIAP